MSQFKTFGIYAGTIFLNAALSFATFSLLTHHLSEVDFGIINLYSATLLFLSPFIGAGVQFALSVDYFKLNEVAYRKHFTNALIIPLSATVLFTVVCFLFQQTITKNIGVNLIFALLLPITSFMMVGNDIITNLIRNKAKHSLFAIFSVGKNVIEIALTILLVVLLSSNWQGRLTSSFFAMLLATAVSIFLISRWKLLSGKRDPKEMKAILFTGLPFIPERLAIFVMGYSDRFFINHYNGTKDVGYYSAGAQIAIIVNLLILTLNNTFYPAFFEKLSKPEIDYKEVRRLLLVFISLIIGVTLCVLIAIPFVFYYFIGPTFASAKHYAINLVVGLSFWGIYNGFLPFLLSLRKNRTIMFISIAGMIFSLVANFFLVAHFGALGATYTSIIVYCFMACTMIFFIHRYYDLRKLFIPRQVM